jgi:hypothetical protein
VCPFGASATLKLARLDGWCIAIPAAGYRRSMASEDPSIGLRRDRHVDLRGRASELWWRRGVIAALAATVIAALAGVFGQQDETARAQSAAATLTVRAPDRVRGGLFFQGRLDIAARERIGTPRVVLGPGWTEELQLNTLEPAPASETSSAGRLELEYDPLQAGDHLTIWMQFEANPTGVGTRERGVTLLDGDRALAHVPGQLTSLP